MIFASNNVCSVAIGPWHRKKQTEEGDCSGFLAFTPESRKHADLHLTQLLLGYAEQGL